MQNLGKNYCVIYLVHKTTGYLSMKLESSFRRTVSPLDKE